jgi:hypothetical protein
LPGRQCPAEDDVLDLTGVDRLIWALSFLGHCVLLAVLIFRRRFANLPVFTAFVVMNIVRTIVLYFALRHGKDQYFNAYWRLGIVDVAVQLLLAYELASHVFKPLGAWAPDVRRSFILLIGGSILIASLLTWLAVPPTKTLRLAIALRGNFFASVLMTEIFVAMMALSVALGLPWRTHVARVAQGLGIYSFTGTLIDAAHGYTGTHRGVKVFAVLSTLQTGFYVVCLTYWIVTLAKNEPAPRKLPEELHNELRALQTKVAQLLRGMRK